MAKSTKNAKNRVSVKNLPAAKTKLTEKDMKKVKGGFQTGGSDDLPQDQIVANKIIGGVKIGGFTK